MVIDSNGVSSGAAHGAPCESAKMDRQNEIDEHVSRQKLSTVSTSGQQRKDGRILDSHSELEGDKLSYPLDIVVQKIQNVVSSQHVPDSSDEDEDQLATREINHALQLQGFKITDKENGADCEIITFEQPSTSFADSENPDAICSIGEHEDPNHAPRVKTNQPDYGATTMTTPTGYVQHHRGRAAGPTAVKVAAATAVGADPTAKVFFKKGHRRAYSMPNAHRERAVLVVADDQVRQEGPRKRHVVRYRLHQYKPSPKTDEAINTFIDAVNFSDFPLPLDPNEDDDLEMGIDEGEIICNTGSRTAATFARRFWEAKWKKQNFEFLPEWLQDNEYLRTGHRPPLASFTSCFKSIFSLHTETGNIWTHMCGCAAFIGVAAWFLSQPATVIAWQDKLVFAFFFAGAITCLGFSFIFHTLQCHSEGVAGIFSKLDYSGISMLIVGSFVPWIYYGFYCRALAMVIYISMISILGISALIVSLWDKFAAPKYRPLRAGVFLAMGLSSVIPAIHLMITDGFAWMFANASLHWLLLMGALYITGACVYMTRFPERFCPGRCDYFCHSHQFFHLFVIVAAFVHFHGITEMTMRRMQDGSCTEQLREKYGSDDYRNFLDRWFRPY